MNRHFWIRILSLVTFAGFSLTASAAIWVTSGKGDTNLYEVDTTGAIVRTVGDTGQLFTGLVYYPPSGKLYGTTSPKSANPGSVFMIDPATGAATLVGAHGIDEAIVDLALANDGTLYGWLEPWNDDLVTINLTTGAATVLGNGPGSGGRGIEFTPGGLVALFDAGLATLLDPVTGLETGGTIVLNGGSDDVNGSARTASGLVYALRGGDSTDTRQLITVDFTTGEVVLLGSISIQNASGIATDGLTIGGDGAGVPVPAVGTYGLALLVLLVAAMGVYLRRRVA